MDSPSLTTLTEHLSKAEAYPHETGDIQIRQTHASVVFLAGAFAYKVKKPVNLGFLDFSTLEKRRHFCKREVQLNRRLAPDVYLGIEPIVWNNGHLEIGTGNNGKAAEWAVRMVRLPERATLTSRLQRREVTPPDLSRIAGLLARFHAEARSDPEVSRYGQFDTVAHNITDNFVQSSAQRENLVTESVFDRLQTLTHEELQHRKALIERRAARNVPRDTHGDLRLDHIYLLPPEHRLHGIVIVDCIEFNDRLRYIDPVADIAFPVMDLKFYRRRDLALHLTDAYFGIRNDPEGRRLLPLYTAYRSVVRAKVLGIQASEPETGPAERERLRRRSRQHWMLALDELATPTTRPALVLTAGLPGTGKSTLAHALAEHACFEVISTDRIRKELMSETTNHDQPYSAAHKDEVYTECLHRSRQILRRGGRVIVDATFHREGRRRSFIALARELNVRLIVFICDLPPERAHRRLARRTDDPSEADWEVYKLLSREWEPIAEEEPRTVFKIDTSGSKESFIREALDHLQSRDLYE